MNIETGKEAEVYALKQEIAELKEWKESAMTVMAPMQDIGKALGVKLGESIHDKILPGIEYWKQLAEAAEKVIQCLPDRPENLYHLGFKQAMNNWQKLKNANP